MTALRSDFLNVLTDRGYIYQCSALEALDEALMGSVVPAYIGFDCTAPSLHVGSLVQIMMLRWLQATGHKPIVLMGGGTTRIGDPSFREEARPLLDEAQIEENKAGIRRVFSRFLRFDPANAPDVGSDPAETAPVGGPDAVMMDNAEWLLALNYVAFLRDVGRHFSVNRMLTFESVRQRLDRDQALSFLEFNYMILQAYDFVELHRRTGCRLQMGGSDQWGNIVNGIDLGRRLDGVELFALTSPLITTASGAKMGKTASGAVWLNADRTSPWEYWQFWRNTADADVGRFMRLFTELPLDEVVRLERLGGAEINEAKKILANEATALLHGRAAAEEAAETARRTFEEGAIAESLPTVTVPRADLAKGIGVLSAFVLAGLAETNGEVRRQIKGGGARLNDEVVTDDRAVIDEGALTADGVVKLSMGRKRHVLIRPA